MNLSDKEIIELRIKCLAPYVEFGAKAGLESSGVLEKAELAWQFAIKPLESKLKTPSNR